MSVIDFVGEIKSPETGSITIGDKGDAGDSSIRPMRAWFKGIFFLDDFSAESRDSN